jgi:hypothetical protein
MLRPSCPSTSLGLDKKLFQALGGGWWNRTDAPQFKQWDIELIP